MLRCVAGLVQKLRHHFLRQQPRRSHRLFGRQITKRYVAHEIVSAGCLDLIFEKISESGHRSCRPRSACPQATRAVPGLGVRQFQNLAGRPQGLQRCHSDSSAHRRGRVWDDCVCRDHARNRTRRHLAIRRHEIGCLLSFAVSAAPCRLGSPALVALPIWADVGLVAAAGRTAGVVEAVGDQVVYAKAHMLPSVIGEGWLGFIYSTREPADCPEPVNQQESSDGA